MLESIKRTVKEIALRKGELPLEITLSGKYDGQNFFHVTRFSEEDLQQPENFFERGTQFGMKYPDVSFDSLFLTGILWTVSCDLQNGVLLDKVERLVICHYDLADPHHPHTSIYQYQLIRYADAIDIGPEEAFINDKGFFGNNAFVDLYREGIKYGRDGQYPQGIPHD